ATADRVLESTRRIMGKRGRPRRQPAASLAGPDASGPRDSIGASPQTESGVDGPGNADQPRNAADVPQPVGRANDAHQRTGEAGGGTPDRSDQATAAEIFGAIAGRDILRRQDDGLHQGSGGTIQAIR